MGISRDRTDRALDRLVEEGILEEVEVQAPGGKGGRGRQPAKGYRRPGATPPAEEGASEVKRRRRGRKRGRAA
jgi:hypothetical protein